MAASKTVTWNGVSSSTIPELVIGKVTRGTVGRRRGTYRDIPGRNGAWFFPQPGGLRNIIMECFVLSADNDYQGRRDAFVDVAEWIAWDEEAKLTISDASGVYYLATLADDPEPDEWRELGTFELRWLAQPFSFDTNVSTEVWTSDTDDTHVWNPGVAGIIYPVITITPTNGTLTDFDLIANGDTLHVGSLNIADDASVTVNSIVPIVVAGTNTDEALLGAYNSEDVAMWNVSGEFPTLNTGSNSIRFHSLGGSATSFSITVYYRKTYRK